MVPLFLETADYILSNHIAIEKKSVHTKDLHQSLRSNRLEKQLARMCLHFKKVCLLIECEEIGDCRKDNFLEFAGEGGRH